MAYEQIIPYFGNCRMDKLLILGIPRWDRYKHSQSKDILSKGLCAKKPHFSLKDKKDKII